MKIKHITALCKRQKDVPDDKRPEYEVRRGALAVNAEDSDPEEEAQ